MNPNALLLESFGRIQEGVHATLDGASPELLTFRPTPDANSIAWLIWHLARVQDDHIADAFGSEQVWTSNGWYERFALPFPQEAHGYGHSSHDVAKVPGDAALLRGYFDDTHAATMKHLEALSADDLDRVVDTRWDPPVTMAVRLISILSDDLQHVGQAAYARGLAP